MWMIFAPSAGRLTDGKTEWWTGRQRVNLLFPTLCLLFHERMRIADMLWEKQTIKTTCDVCRQAERENNWKLQTRLRHVSYKWTRGGSSRGDGDIWKKQWAHIMDPLLWARDGLLCRRDPHEGPAGGHINTQTWERPRPSDCKWGQWPQRPRLRSDWQL